MPKIKAVLFDLDGTLVDSLPELYDGVRRALLEIGQPVPSQDAVRDMIGRGVSVLAERVRQYLHLTDNDVTQETLLGLFVKYWALSDGRQTTFFPGVLEAMTTLKSQGISVGLVTNKWRELTLEFLAQRGLQTFFDVIIAGDDCPRNKPAPDMLLKAMETLHVLPVETVMVGDSRNDALAARSAGVIAALVETGYNEGVPISEWAREAGFTHVYPTACKVCELISKQRF